MSQGTRAFRHPVCGCCGANVAGHQSRIGGRIWTHRSKRAESRCGRPSGVCELEKFEADCISVASDVGAIAEPTGSRRSKRCPRTYDSNVV